MYKKLVFKESLIQAILDGRKTQTRRPVKTFTCPYGEPGDQIKIYGSPDKRLDIPITIYNISIDRIQNISEEDIIAEGIHGYKNQWNTCCETDTKYKSTPRKAFIYLWDSIYTDTKYRWDYNPLVWVIKFNNEEKQSE